MTRNWTLFCSAMATSLSNWATATALFRPGVSPYKRGGPLVLVDLNGDGYLDIAALFRNSSPPAPQQSQAAIFLNQGATAPGVFASPKLFAAPNGTAGLLAAGDFNGDGKQDLMIPTLVAGIPLPMACI